MAIGTSQATRIYFVDYLRAAIIILVILHHTAITYGASGSWYYTEPATDPIASLILLLFVNFNQAWFLGLFFLLSAYFTPTSYDRKGPLKFLKDRLIRLGIPLLVFYFILNPITVYLAFYNATPALAAQNGLTLPLTLNLQFFLSNAGTGPLWFVEMLLIFDIGYMAWRMLSNKIVQSKKTIPQFPSYANIAIFILALAVSAYLIRIAIPLGATVLGLPSPFDLAQYVGLFIIGLIAVRGNWLIKMPYQMAKKVFIVALVASVTLLPLSLIGTVETSWGWGSLIGSGSLSSFIYALWDSTFAVGACMFVIGLFRKHFNSAGGLYGLTKDFYAAYVIQATVIVAITVFLLAPIQIESLLKFAMASVIIVPTIWIIADLIRRIPLVDRVL